MVLQLGIPTWFFSFSAADRRWPETVAAILRQQNKAVPQNILWDDHCKVIASNPVTAVMFQKRVKHFIRDVILSPAHPVGEIKDYFYRVEFQQRGWPHIHCLFWVKYAPVIDLNNDDHSRVQTFVDKYITCDVQDSTKPVTIVNQV